jgi:hypothetical protein
MQTKVFLKSPAGDVTEVSVSDPKKDLVPLMVQGYRQVFLDDHPPAAAPAVAPHQAGEEK